jgi:hypothetical protein
VPSLKPHLNHTTVVAYLALFTAVGGSAYAAANITGNDIVNGSVTGVDLRNNSVKSADVKGITGSDLGSGAPWTLRSPNGRFSIGVTNSGVKVDGPRGDVTVDDDGVGIDSNGRVDIKASGTVRIQGAIVGLNGTCRPVADATKVFDHTHVAPEGGGVTSIGSGPSPGFPTVLAC